MAESTDVRDHGQAQGPAGAPLVLVEYGDYQCPYSSRAERVVGRVLAELGERVKLVYRHFPLADHPHAFGAAEAAVLAGDRGMFWPMHRLLFAGQHNLARSDLVGYAERIGLDPEAFAAALDSHQAARRVPAQADSGTRRGVRATPTFLAGGQLLVAPGSHPDLVDALLCRTPFPGAPPAASPMT